MSDIGKSTGKLIKKARFPVFYEMAQEDGDSVFQEDTNLFKFLYREDNRNSIKTIKKLYKSLTMMKMNLKNINKNATLISKSNKG